MALPAWVSEVGIAAQVSIAFLAVYGDKVRGWLSTPRLRIALPEGQDDHELKQIDQSIVTVSYRRLHVRNSARYSIASEVQVFTTKIERLEPAGQVRAAFSGAVPLAWQHQALYPNARNVGHSTIAAVDLLYLSLESIHLTPVDPAPLTLGDAMRGPQHFWISVIARGLNAESEEARLEIRWDGARQLSITLL